MYSRSAKLFVLILSVGMSWSLVASSLVVADDNGAPTTASNAIGQPASAGQGIGEHKGQKNPTVQVDPGEDRRGRTRRSVRPQFRRNAPSTDRTRADTRFPNGMFQQSFAGVINQNGKVMRARTPQEFERLRRQFGLPGVRMPNLPAAGNAPFDQAFDGVINLNGREFRANNLDEMRRLQQQLGLAMPNLQNLNGNNANNGNAFDGMINNNGQIQRFNDADAFNRAQQQLFGQ